MRFQLAANMLNPEISVYAPWRDPAFLDEFGGRKEMIDFCNARGLPVTATHEKPYSTDANLLGLTHEAGRLESLKTPARFITPGMGIHPEDAPDEVEYFTVAFSRGIPVEINGSPDNAAPGYIGSKPNRRPKRSRHRHPHGREPICRYKKPRGLRVARHGIARKVLRISASTYFG